MSWEDELDEAQRREWDLWVAHVREDTVKKMAKSAFVASLCPSGETDIKFAVETGLAILMDKPIVVIAVPGREVPPGLRRVAHAVIELEGDIDTEAGRVELNAKLRPILDEFA